MRNSLAMRGETVTYLQNDRKRVGKRRQVPQLLRPGAPVPSGAFGLLIVIDGGMTAIRTGWCCLWTFYGLSHFRSPF
jgi:hypothetical protein